MYKIKLMGENEKEKFNYYKVWRVNYKAIKNDVEDVVKKAIGTINLKRLKEGLHESIPWYYPFFKENLREAAYEVADLLKVKQWLDKYLKSERLEEEASSAYYVYSLYILEE